MMYKTRGWLAYASLWRARFVQSQGYEERKYIHVAGGPATQIRSRGEWLSADAVSRAKASVQEVRKLLLGCKKDRTRWLDCDDTQAAGSAMPLSETRFDDFNL